MPNLLSLSTELRLEIINCIVESDDEAPSEINFDKEPTVYLTRSSEHPLKDLSLVCSELRELVLPQLFAYCNVYVLEKDASLLEQQRGDSDIDSESVASIVVPKSTSSFHELLYTGIKAFTDFITTRGLHQAVKSLSSRIWDSIFEKLDLTRIILAVPPKTIFTLMATRTPSFGELSELRHAQPTIQIQYLGLECTNKPKIRTSNSERSHDESLWSCRTWTHFAYNEGGLTIDRVRKVVEANQQILKLRNRRLPLQDMPLGYNDHSLLVLQILGDLGNSLISGSKIRSIHFISCFPDRRFVGRVLEQTGLEKIRYWKTKFVQPELFEEVQKLKIPQLTATFLGDWKLLHRQFGENILSRLARDRMGATWLSSDQLDRYVWGFSLGMFAMLPASDFPPDRTVWIFQ
ncbi:hypothetical protein FKW77_008011 [Venturia effusa]|uniref:Uncharacterized protein n=1 Tax=Venturia effusa TaxID=50376 RepID=A0A517L9N8_9PEZI|nr:hypothetical protein FKW77_008011 [Venturia effusa]